MRIATMKEFPTEEEMEAEGVSVAGAFVLQLKDEKRFDDFLATHSREWKDELRQPIARCVEHLLSVVCWSIYAKLDKAKCTKELSGCPAVTKAEVKLFIKRVHADHG